MVSQLTASHLAAPVSQRQKPILMAPAKRRMMFHGISSRSSMSMMPVTKNMIVEIRMMAVLSMGLSAGMKERRAMTVMQVKTMTMAMISCFVMGPRS